MPLTLTCPHCRSSLAPREPLPAPATEARCPVCEQTFRVRYPADATEQLGLSGARVATDGRHGPFHVVRREAPRAAPPPPPGATPPVARPSSAPPPPAPRPSVHPPPSRRPEAAARPEPVPPTPEPVPPTRRTEPARGAARPASSLAVDEEVTDPGPVLRPVPPPPRRRVTPGRVALAFVVAVGLAVAGYGGLHLLYASDLPSVEALRAYRPATVTSVFDRNGELLGEIFEEKRYVLPLDRIPERVQQAFVAAEDASFWEHGGMDWTGIARAMARNAMSGRVTQGGSTITQQVAKNFLLTSDRRLARKFKEMFLAWRIEDAYEKDHILYLYLNEIFLGSQAYGVEAAARTFFGKHVEELSLGEAALIAGLPPRPSEWNPHAGLDIAKRRQAYVLGRMVDVGYISQAEADAAAAEELVIVPRGNTFLDQAPHFTEHVRRWLVERYGEERVLAEGLQVTTTCDLALQREAQRTVNDRVVRLDQQIGLRREAVETLADAAAIGAWRRAQAEAIAADAASIATGRVTDAVVLEVDKTWARLGVGEREGLLPLAWAAWAYPPDATRNSRYRKQDDLRRTYDFEGDVVDGPILRVGDVLRVRVEGASDDPAFAQAFQGTEGLAPDVLALRLQQVPEVEAALLSFELSDDPEVSGAVRAMVGGADFGRSQLNRAVQARRQVGSTIKPIVYAAALDTRRLTTASIVPDAPFALGSGDDIWKPENYGGDYRGNITLRQALVLSRNTSTVRVLDAVDRGMNRGVIDAFAGRLGLGSTPTHLRPEGWAPSPDTDHLCPWVPKGSMRSCSHASTLPDGTEVCRACDASIALGSTSLTMEELARAYAVIGNSGRYVEPWYVLEVRDRDGVVIDRHEPTPAVQVVDAGVADLTTWMLEQVATYGTGAGAHRDLRVHVAGKTGTTNDEKDAWFVGYTRDVVTAVWVGFDQPRSLGTSATGGHTALPIWVDYMEDAIKGRKDRAFPMASNVEWAPIEESTGRRVSSGGRSYPFLMGTVPKDTGYRAGETTTQDLATEL